MKLAFIIILSLNFFANTYSQGITLLYKGGGLGWNDPVNWIQINTAIGHTPIQRAPTELDDVVFSSSQSGLSSVTISFENSLDSLEVGSGSSTNYECRS